MSSTLDTRIHTPCVPATMTICILPFLVKKSLEIINDYLNAMRYVHVCTRYLRFHKLFEQKRRRLTFSATETPIRFVQITRVSCFESPPFRFGPGNGNSGLDDEERVRGGGSVHRKLLNAKIDYASRRSKRISPENLDSHSRRVRTVLEFDGGKD